jgi:MscS family membrane protein
MNDANLSQATQALDLSEINMLERADRGPQLAFKLWAILNRETYIEIDDLSNSPTAPSYVLPITSRRGTKVGRVTVAKGADGAYRFTPETLVHLDDLWAQVSSKPVVSGLTDPSPEQLNPAAWLEERMPGDTRERVLGMATWKWVVVVMIFTIGAAVFLALRGLTFFLAKRVLKLERSSHEYQDLMQAGVGITLVVVAGLIVRDLPFLEIRGVLGGLIGFGARVLAVFGFVLIGFAAWDWGLRAYIRRAGAANHSKRLVAPVIARLGRAVILCFAVLGVCEALGFRPSTILATLGISGLVIAFAAKDSIENVFGSIVVLVESPFTIGDWVRIGDVSGTVEDIRLRSTRIRTFDDTIVIFPNSALITQSVENYGMRRYRRFKTTIALAVDTPPEKLTEFTQRVRTMLVENPHVSDERRVVHLNDFGTGMFSVLLDCYLIAPDAAAELEYRDRVLTGVVEIAQSLGIGFFTPAAISR